MNENITGKKIATGMVWRLGEKLSAQIVSLVVSITLARILSPEDYGAVAIVMVFISIADIFVTSGISTSLIQKKDATDLDFSTVFYCGLVLSIVLYLVLFLVAPIISRVYQLPVLTNVIRVFAIKLPISAFNSVQNAIVSRKLDFKKFFYATLMGTIISGVVGIAMAVRGFGVWALVVQYLTNSIIDTLVLFFTLKWIPKKEFSVEAAKPLVSYGWKIMATDLIGQIFNQVNSFVIGLWYSAKDLAFYTQGKKYPDLVDNTLSGTLNSVLFPAMSQQDTKESIINIRRKSMCILEYILFPLMIGMTVIADNMIEVLLTRKWIDSVFYVRVSCLYALVGILGITLVQEIKAIGRSDISLKIELIKKPIFLVVVFICMQFGVEAVACSLLINQIIAFVINMIPVKKYIGFNILDHIEDATPSFVISMIMGVVVYFVSFLNYEKIVVLILQVLVGSATYIGLSWITQNKSFIYLKFLIVDKMGK